MYLGQLLHLEANILGGYLIEGEYLRIGRIANVVFLNDHVRPGLAVIGDLNAEVFGEVDTHLNILSAVLA